VSGRYLLDTNAAIALLNGESAILAFVRLADELFLPVIAIGELYFGVEKSGRPDSNRATLQGFLQGKTVLSCDLAIAEEYGRVRGVLRKQGNPLPDNDTWIAAIALRHGLSLVTRDKHFGHVKDLPSVTW
jgi:tRNA(fMet)-specific endonuclease VapC